MFRLFCCTMNGIATDRFILISYYRCFCKINAILLEPIKHNCYDIHCRILKVAQAFSSSSITFAMSDVQDFEQELAELGLTADPTQPTVIGRHSENKSYVMNEDFS